MFSTFRLVKSLLRITMILQKKSSVVEVAQCAGLGSVSCIQNFGGL